MRATARFLTALVLAGLLLLPTPVQSAPADLKILDEVLVLLRIRHWNPSLEMPAIVRAGVPGLNRTLARVGVTQRLDPIPESADEPATIAAFRQRLDEAVRLAGGRFTERDLLYGALRSMFERVGRLPHNRFLTPYQRQALVASNLGQGSVGIGTSLRRGADQWIFAEVVPGSPAASAGVRRGDAVLRIDDVIVSELSGDDVNAMILGDGQPDTQVRLTLRRGTEERQVSVTRGIVPWLVAEGRVLADGIAYLHVYFFPSAVSGGIGQIRNRFAQLMQAQPRGLVLDLRSNNGGADESAFALLGLFLPRGTRTFQAFKRDGQAYFGATTVAPVAPALPLTVLINQHTWSNGEVVAAAFQETGRASLAGERTYGAVELAPRFPLSDGSAVVIPTERTLTAQGREIEGRGVSPDVEFAHDLTADRDLLLERAVQLLLQRLR